MSGNNKFNMTKEYLIKMWEKAHSQIGLHRRFIYKLMWVFIQVLLFSWCFYDNSYN